MPANRSSFSRRLSVSCLATVLDSTEVRAVGMTTVGRLGDQDEIGCEGTTPGRPLRIAGVPRLASVCERSDWQHSASPWVEGMSEGLRERLAALWTRDAQLEHASVAAFARHALELLALGAPPELLAEVARAQVDEIEHARLCFGIASAYAGHPLGPAKLGLSELGREFSVDPLTVARDLFASGCVNESFAAVEAARAAELAEDPILVELLERIADDEARHAALAWRTLAWLSARYGQVAQWLRARLGRLDDSLEITLAPFSDADDLAEHGRLSERERVVLQRQAIATIIRPTLLVLTGMGFAASGHSDPGRVSEPGRVSGR